jgi:DNA polymerase-3 subunit alpha
VDKAIEFGMPAVAITDHGNLFGAIEFYEKCTKKGVKPIIGCEVYVAPHSRFIKNSKISYHLILLVKNEEGYKNLCKLVSKSYIEGFYYKPRIDKDLLRQYNKGLIALSACLKGEIPQYIISNKIEESEKIMQDFCSIFDNERFYLEVQENGIAEQNKANESILNIGKKYGIPLVATNDCHYLMKEDYEAHDVLLCIQTGKTVEDTNRMKFTTKDLYFKSTAEMSANFSGYPEEVIKNTIKIANECDFNFRFGEFHFPRYKSGLSYRKIGEQSEPNHGSDKEIMELQNQAYQSNGLIVSEPDLNGDLKPLSADEPIIQLINEANSLFELEARNGFKERFIINPKMSTKEAYEAKPNEYEQRLEMEIDTIKKSKFAGYFLIVSDFIKYAKERNIPVGPGRGSAAGSLVAYCLKITEIDPIRYDLMFERFLNPERISMPDIDSDFCINGRDEVIKYVAEKYGQDQVSQIITFGSMLAKAVIRDTGRALNMPYSEVDKIAKLVPDTLKITLDEAIKKEPKLRELINTNPKIKKLIEIAKKLEGLTRHASTHAAGVVIANKPLNEYLPLYKGTKDNDVITTQYTMEWVEKLGLIKFDFLGLKTLTVMKEAIKLINNKPDKLAGISDEKPTPFDIYNIDLNDAKTFRLLASGDTTGVFQLESSGMKDILIKLAPKCFEDIIPLVALYRPGPLGSGMVDDFIKVKHGLKKIKYIHPLLKNILQETYGVILYQEQIMKIAIKLANFSMGDADYLRKGVGKKNAELIEKMRTKFIDGCRNNAIEIKTAEKIFSLITKFGEYGFNKSHSTAYALVAYMTAYLKANYKDYFIAALLSSEMSNTDKLAKILFEVTSSTENKCNIIAPSVNSSMMHFTVLHNEPASEFTKEGADLTATQNVIQIGLGAIKSIGEAAIESILKERENASFKDLLDFCSRVDTRKVNKRTIENLIKSGSFDYSGKSRIWMLDNLEKIMQQALSIREKQSSAELELPLVSIDDYTDCAPKLNEGYSSADFSNNMQFLNHEPGIDLSGKDDKKALLTFEKDALGFYISGHPLDGYGEKIKLMDYTISSLCSLTSRFDSLENDLSQEKVAAKSELKITAPHGGSIPNKNVDLCGVINQLKIHRTKNNEKMASFILSETIASIQVVFFPKNYSKYEDLFNTAEPVVITGKVDIVPTLGQSSNHERGESLKPYNSAEVSDNNLKIIGESITLLDNYIIKEHNNISKQDLQDLCIIEFPFDNRHNDAGVAGSSSDNLLNHYQNDGLLQQFLFELRRSLLDYKGISTVLIKTKNFEIKLNDNITIDKEALKRSSFAKNIIIR